MNANAFRQFYDYHFAENRKLWALITPLSYEQFTQPVSYSYGSVRNQLVHLMRADEDWFGPLRHEPPTEPIQPVDYDDREALRAHWDALEQKMRDYLANLRDEMVFEHPFPGGEDKDLILWQVLLHVVNHGTDHRAQMLRILSDLGVKTTSQDFIFYVFDHVSKT